MTPRLVDRLGSDFVGAVRVCVEAAGIVEERVVDDPVVVTAVVEAEDSPVAGVTSGSIGVEV